MRTVCVGADPESKNSNQSGFDMTEISSYMATESDSAPMDLWSWLREGNRIATIFLFWGVLAALGRYGVANIGISRPGEFFFEVGNGLTFLFVVTGLANVLLYIIARGIQLSRR